MSLAFPGLLSSAWAPGGAQRRCRCQGQTRTRLALSAVGPDSLPMPVSHGGRMAMVVTGTVTGHGEQFRPDLDVG